jgi:hypothetical protein
MIMTNIVFEKEHRTNINFIEYIDIWSKSPTVGSIQRCKTRYYEQIGLPIPHITK